MDLYTSQIDIASNIAREAHRGQKHFFGAGEYFDLHLMPIAANIARTGLNGLFVATGLTHDLFEDTDVSPDEALKTGLHTNVVEASVLLARQDGQPQQDYLNGIISSDFATVAKFFDSSYNFSWTMLNSPHPKISNEEFISWGLEYANNISFLLPHVERIIADK